MSVNQTNATSAAGTTSAAFQSAVQLRVNWYRAMAGIPASIAFDPVNYGAGDQLAALMMSANNELSHYPTSNWLLYTSAGATAAANSNIAIGSDGPASIDGYISDPGSNNTAVGHRRWLLYPQTQTMGTGDIDAVNGFLATNATWVIDGNFGTTRPPVRDNFVAWPPPGYVPYQSVYPRWSFAYPNADFSQATVTMTSGSTSVPVSLEVLDNPAYGENTLVWDYNGLDGNTVTSSAPEPGADTAYNVQINNVLINNVATNFSYTVTVFDPAVAGSGDLLPAVNGPSQFSVGQQMDFSVANLPSFANGFEFRAVTSVTPDAAVLNASGGLQGIVPDISEVSGSEAYNPIDTTVTYDGNASYHLAQPDQTEQTLTLPGYFLFSSGSASLQFESELKFATSHQTAHVQISVDDGNTWADLFTQSGIDTVNTPVQTAFQAESLSLKGYARVPFQIRFAYTYDQSGGALYQETTHGVGWNFDAIGFTGVDNATPGSPSSFIAGNVLGYTPASAGTYGLQAREVLFGLYPDEWGPVSLATAKASTGAAPSFTIQPQGQTLNSGSTVVFSAAASAGSTYQWVFNGVTLANSTTATSDVVAGATRPQLVITNTTAASAGTYTVIATNANGSTSSSSATLSVVSSNTPGSIGSISARAFVGTEDNLLIGGFYINGTTSATVLVQAIGPSLASPPYNVTGVLADPELSIHQTQGGKDVTLYSNTGWGSSPVLLSAAASAYANPVLQPGSADSELLLTLPPGGYTAEVAAADGKSTGVALCAIYQLP